MRTLSKRRMPSMKRFEEIGADAKKRADWVDGTDGTARMGGGELYVWEPGKHH